MDIRTKIISPFFARRQRAIKSFGKQTVDIQRQQLRYLLGKARNTAWGKRYAFAEISGYDTFRERVPLQDYENFHPFIERMINGEKDVLWLSSLVG